MKYYIEVYTNEDNKNFHVLKNSYQPREALRKILKHYNTKFLTVYVLNEKGKAWKYTIQMKGAKYHIIKERKFYHILSRDEIINIVTGDMTIRGIFNGS